MISIIRLLVIVLFAVLVPLSAVGVYAAEEQAPVDPLKAICEQTPDSPVCSPEPGPTAPENDVIIRIANLLATIGGVIAVVIIIVAGITMMTSGGDPGKVKSSRDAIIYALVGVIVILLSQVIVRFAINIID
jgi:type IV secretory pathway VirB2 component (pilin)